jgi:hypothetical protein
MPFFVNLSLFDYLYLCFSTCTYMFLFNCLNLYKSISILISVYLSAFLSIVSTILTFFVFAFPFSD